MDPQAPNHNEISKSNMCQAKTINDELLTSLNTDIHTISSFNWINVTLIEFLCSQFQST